MNKLQKKGVQMAALGLAVAFALAASPAFAAGAKAPGHGLQVAIDPATGQIRQPTAAESRALAAPVAAKSTTGPQFTYWPDGTISAVLTEDFLNVWVVQLNANGSTSQVCVDGANAASAQANPAFEEK